MTIREADRALLAYVNRALNRGDRRIAVPVRFLAGASDETLKEVRRLVKLAGAEIVEVRG